MVESIEQNTEPKENLPAEDAKEKDFEPQWGMVKIMKQLYYDLYLLFILYVLLGSATPTTSSQNES